MTKRRCIVIIVGFDRYQNGLDEGDGLQDRNGLEDRDGLEENVRDIKETFTELFEAEFITLINKTKEEILAEYETFHSKDWTKKFEAVHFVSIFCLSHGQSDGQIVLPGKNQVTNARRLLLHPLFKFEELDGKLKWLIVQACRGNMNDYKPMQRDGIAKVYPEDHLVSYCTGEATTSFQTDNRGKIYIRYLCEELRTNSEQLSLCKMLKNVAAAVKMEFDRTQSSTTFQQPSFKKNFNDYNFF